MSFRKQDLKDFRHAIFAVQVAAEHVQYIKGPYNTLATAKGQRTRAQREHPGAEVTLLGILEPDWEEVLD